MSHAPLTPDDPRLTAYVLGELEEAERTVVEEHLAADPDCRRVIEELQAMSASLFEALQSEPVPALSAEQRDAIRQGAEPVAIRRPNPPEGKRRGLVVVLTATAVCAALLVGVSVHRFASQEHTAGDFISGAESQLALVDSAQPFEIEELGESIQPMDLRRLSRERSKSGARDEGAIVDFDTEMRERNVGSADRNVESRSERLRDYEQGFAANAAGKPVVPGDLGDPADLSFRQSGGASDTPSALLPSLAVPNTEHHVSGLDPSQPAPASGPEAALGVTLDEAESVQVRLGGITESAPAPESEPGAVGGLAGRRVAQPAPSAGSANGQTAGATTAPTPAPTAAAPDGYYAGHRFLFVDEYGAAAGDSSVHRFGESKLPLQQSAQSPSTTAEGLVREELESRDLATAQSRTENLSKKLADQTDLSINSPYRRSEEDGRESQNWGLVTVPVAATTSHDGMLVPGDHVDVLFTYLTPSGQTTTNVLLEDIQVVDPGNSPANGQRTKDVSLLISPEQVSHVIWAEKNGNLSLFWRRSGDVESVKSGAADKKVLGFLATDLQGTTSTPTIAGRTLAREGEWYFIEGTERPQIAGVVPATRGETRGWRIPATPLGRSSTHLSWIDGVAPQTPGTEAYAPIQENDFLSVDDAPLSTFGLDVDTASYANVRRFLMEEGRFPPSNAVRIEELVNYFAYSDTAPADDEPLAVHLEAAACPWDTDHRLVRIGLKAKSMDLAERPPTTLVFLVDTSGSMRDENKLPLVKQSLRLLVDEMTENDRIAIVTYNTNAGLLLDSTSGEHQDEIIAAIDGLNADGSTNGEAGLKLAYDVATQHFIKSGQNRVILCTDGDFNVGTSDTDPLVGMISEKRASGVFLSICGYGTGNIKDEKLERIADKGNGQYHYVDGLKEARKVFLDELTGTLYTIAKDVKLQVEFNPQRVAAYRLLGYENRTLAAEDFNNDRVDSGDMGAGHSVTALYELIPAGTEIVKPASETPGVDPLKYQGSGGSGQRSEVGGRKSESERFAATQRGARTGESPVSTELLTVNLRYKQPDADESVKREFPLVDDVKGSPSEDLEWSAAVASFGMLLRGSRHAGQSSLEGVLELAQGAKGRDESGRRREFIDMLLQTQSLVRRVRGQSSPEPRELSSVEARQKASVGGKYGDLLDKLENRSDVERYGAFHDYGWSADKSYAGRDGLPAGYWVYVYPDWYIWGETVATDAKASP